jgi:hypothetical protein
VSKDHEKVPNNSTAQDANIRIVTSHSLNVSFSLKDELLIEECLNFDTLSIETDFLKKKKKKGTPCSNKLVSILLDFPSSHLQEFHSQM